MGSNLKLLLILLSVLVMLVNCDQPVEPTCENDQIIKRSNYNKTHYTSTCVDPSECNFNNTQVSEDHAYVQVQLYDENTKTAGAKYCLPCSNIFYKCNKCVVNATDIIDGKVQMQSDEGTSLLDLPLDRSKTDAKQYLIPNLNCHKCESSDEYPILPYIMQQVNMQLAEPKICTLCNDASSEIVLSNNISSSGEKYCNYLPKVASTSFDNVQVAKNRVKIGGDNNNDLGIQCGSQLDANNHYSFQIAHWCFVKQEGLNESTYPTAQEVKALVGDQLVTKPDYSDPQGKICGQQSLSKSQNVQAGTPQTWDMSNSLDVFLEANSKYTVVLYCLDQFWQQGGYSPIKTHSAETNDTGAIESKVIIMSNGTLSSENQEQLACVMEKYFLDEDSQGKMLVKNSQGKFCPIVSSNSSNRILVQEETSRFLFLSKRSCPNNRFRVLSSENVNVAYVYTITPDPYKEVAPVTKSLDNQDEFKNFIKTELDKQNKSIIINDVQQLKLNDQTSNVIPKFDTTENTKLEVSSSGIKIKLKLIEGSGLVTVALSNDTSQTYTYDLMQSQFQSQSDKLSAYQSAWMEPNVEKEFQFLGLQGDTKYLVNYVAYNFNKDGSQQFSEVIARQKTTLVPCFGLQLPFTFFMGILILIVALMN